MGTWITVSIHITATAVHIRHVETSPSITSTEMRCGMGEDTQAADTIARDSVQLQESWEIKRRTTRPF
jgi:hypothetical protein